MTETVPQRPATSISKLAAAFNFLVIVGIVAMAGVAGLAIDTLRIGSPMYDKIISSKDLVADVLPPPLYVIEAFQEVSRLEDALAEVDQRAERLKTLRAQYAARHAFWIKSRYPEEIKRKLTVDSDREARRFWAEIDNHFLPAVKSGDRARARQSFARISAAYDAHRKIVDDIVVAANGVSTQVEKTATNETRWYLSIVAGVTILALTCVVFALRMMQSRVTEPLIQLADYMKESRGAKSEPHAPFVSRGDEIGAVAQAVESFRSHIEERVLEAKNVQLDAALNNIVQGLEMFDADGRLALRNGRFLQIYGLDEAEARPGLSLAEVVGLRVERGLLTQEAAETLVARIELARTDPSEREFHCHLTDERCIDIAIQPMRDGSGFVATHQDVTEQRRTAARIAYFAHHDSLTGLPNRMRLTEQLEKALSYARRGELVAVHALDLDHFKSVNDSLGHPVGDKLLKIVADRLRSELRETDSCGRMGGDELTIVERQIEAPVDAVALASRLIKIISEPYDIDGHRIVIGASVGIAVGPQDGASAEELLRNADLALYRAKAEARGTFRFFEPAMDAQMQARATLERDLRSAVANGEFELHYQPIVNVKSSDICGFEALLRWRHPEKGLIAPDAFIPLAEETRLIVPIGEWVLREACAAAAGWPGNLNIAVNLSAAQFHHGSVRKAVSEALAQSGLDAHRLELEITETLLLDGNERTLDTLHHLRAIGAQITMDDFGTGYSSLSYLQSFPFDKIKIDKSFVQAIDGEGKSLKIVRAVATLANGLGIKTTAEGVESLEQLDAIRSEGCTEIQGYLMSKPLRLCDVEQFLRVQFPPKREKLAAA